MNATKIRLLFTSGLEVEFVDREGALKQAEELAEKGTRFQIGRASCRERV